MKAHYFFFIAILSWQCSQPTASAQVSKSTNDGAKIKSIEYYQIDIQSGDKAPQGNMNCATTNESGEQVYFYKKKMDGKNMVEEKSTYGITKYSYDKNDNLILKEEFDSDGKFFQAEKNEIIYIKGTSDLKGIITYQKDGDGDFKKFNEIFYTYENGELVKETYTTDYYYYIYFYEYYSNGNLKEKTTLQGKKEKVITKYHENGQRRIEAIFRSETEDSEMILEQKNKWTYDKHDNLILTEIFRNDKLVTKKIDEITYY